MFNLPDVSFMRILPINNLNSNSLTRQKFKKSTPCLLNRVFNENKNQYSDLNFLSLQYYLSNINSSPVFTGTSSELSRVYSYSQSGGKQTIKRASNGSYLIDEETKTKIYYGKDAKQFLDKTTVFSQDTQVICPNDGELKVEVDDREIFVISDGAVILQNGKKAKITVIKGNPLVVTSEKKPDWYEEYTNNPTNKEVAQRYAELSDIYFHLYSGHINIKNLGEDIAIKLLNSKNATLVGKNYIKMDKYYSPDYMKNILADVLDDDEMKIFSQNYNTIWKVRLSTKEARKASGEGLNKAIREKLKKSGLITDLEERDKDRIYWLQMYADESSLQAKLESLNFTEKEQKEVIQYWKDTNKLGFDYTGLKYLSDDIAVYCLQDRVNNITGGSQCWNTFSVIAPTIKEGFSSPYIGVSAVHSNEEYKNAVPFKEIRNAEVLHSHYINPKKHQIELYLVTEGAGALTIIEDSKPKTIVLKQGEGIILNPGVIHSTNAIRGKYEHLVCQIPSISHYTLPFKVNYDYPEDYPENKAVEDAVYALNKI